MRESETFGSEKGSGEELVQWLNEEAVKRKMKFEARLYDCLLYTSPSPRDATLSRMPSSA